MVLLRRSRIPAPYSITPSARASSLGGFPLCRAASLGARPCPLWSKADIAARPPNVRFTPESGHRRVATASRLSANTGLRTVLRLLIGNPNIPAQNLTAEVRGSSR
jgi:hypothetical protein